MSSVFAQIEQAIITALNQPSTVCWEAAVKRDHGLPAEIPQAVYVSRHRAGAGRSAIAGAPVDWDSTFIVECYARGTADVADEALDSMLTQVYARLAADSTLGGLVADCFLTDIEWSSDALDQRCRMATMLCRVLHTTSNFTVE